MFLKNLKIENGEVVIRDIPFKKGVNLIVDETKTSDKKESGNNVGKTTVLRLVDFCLGGNGKNIYTDIEFKAKNNNSLVEKFLKEESVVITLTLVEDIEDESAETVVIRRNFLLRNRKIQEINGQNYNDTDFDMALKKIFFKTDQEKPSFKQIVSKNIRDEEEKLTNTIRVLGAYATKEDYEALYLFWLGIDVNDVGKKALLQQQKTIEENLQKRLKKDGALPQIEQSITVVNRVIDGLEKKKTSFNLNEDFDKEFSELNDIKSEINKISTELGSLKMRRNLIIESKEELENDFANVDVEKIQALYDKAKVFIPELHATFEDALSFHNDMLKEKIEFITQELPEIEAEINKLRNELDSFLIKEKNVAQKLHKVKTMEDLEFVITELNSAYEKKGQLSEQKKIWDESNRVLRLIDESLNQINRYIFAKDNLIKERIEEFNKYFSELSYKLYGERFILSPDKTERAYELNISSIEGNLGTGKKKGQIAAFDFAYINFADSVGIRCLHFILHDQIENIHGNQIDTVLLDIASATNCQYIVPVLKDKLPPNVDIEKYKILSLSQEDRLFRID
jgi:uncharacterized protein YydD (DUF2326 family)